MPPIVDVSWVDRLRRSVAHRVSCDESRLSTRQNHNCNIVTAHAAAPWSGPTVTRS